MKLTSDSEYLINHYAESIKFNAQHFKGWPRRINLLGTYIMARRIAEHISKIVPK